MKRFLSVALAVATALLMAACGDDDEGGSSVGSESASYEVDLPEGWEEASDEEKEEAAALAGVVVDDATGGEGIEGVAVTSFWANGDLNDVATPNIIVIREPVPGGLDFDEFVDISNQNIRAIFGDALTSEIVEADPIDVAGEPAPTFDYDASFTGVDQAKRVVFIDRGDQAYTLTLSSPPEDADAVAADLDEILATWEWTD